MFDKINLHKEKKHHESLEKYHNRLKFNDSAIKNYLKGTLFHNSSSNGTYKKVKI